METSPYGNYINQKCKKVCIDQQGNMTQSPLFVEEYDDHSHGSMSFQEKITDCVTNLYSAPCEGSFNCIPRGNSGELVDIKYIRSGELAAILQAKGELDVNLVIVDCRYPYEYQGGHIQGSINLFSNEMIHKAFMSVYEAMRTQDKHADLPANNKLMIVFHCEFSSVRGPAGYRYLREHDRRMNVMNYPELCYPNMFLLEDGYKKFHQQYQNLCAGGYVEMVDKRYADKLRLYKRVQKVEKSERLRKRSLFGDAI